MPNLAEPLIERRNAGKLQPLAFGPRRQLPSGSSLKPHTGDQARQIKMFLHGGESSIVTEGGDYNVHRYVPRIVKYYLNWTRDTFPSIVRLSWLSLMFVFISIKLVTISVFATVMKSLDSQNPGVCVTNASSYSDFFYFVVQTIFTIGYGLMSPVCHWSNLMVTVISFFGMFQMATFTGIFFAKFSMDPKRNFACAFTTHLVGVPPLYDDGFVRFNFRFVNVFHRRYFRVSCRHFLIEHRMNPVIDKWMLPLVEELSVFDTSAPLEFMSLPIEVCTYVPFARLVQNSGSLRISQWVRQGTPGQNFPTPCYTETNPDIPINSEFEIVCILVFTDATTGCEIAVRKAWSLADTVWVAGSPVQWTDIIHRDDKSDSYFVDVAGLDGIDNETLLSSPPEIIGEPAPLGSPAMSPAFRLINTMTMPARGGNVLRPSAASLFPSIPEV